jgi:DNA-binding transcriptional ArsR family regulator
MPRAATTSDVFNAIAEPRRREIIELLARAPGGEYPVMELVHTLRIPQSAMSKHLGVLRKVGLVTVTKNRQQRLYRLNGKELKQVHDWVQMFERFWEHHISRIKQRAEEKARLQRLQRKQEEQP